MVLPPSESEYIRQSWASLLVSVAVSRQHCRYRYDNERHITRITEQQLKADDEQTTMSEVVQYTLSPSMMLL